MTQFFENLEHSLKEINNHLLELKEYAQLKETSAKEDTEEIGGIDLAMKVTGLSRSTIYALRHKGAIPYHKAKGGKNLYFNKTELLNWIKNH